MLNLSWNQFYNKDKTNTTNLFYPQTPVRVVGDPARVRQVLSNLLVNAVKFSSRGDITLSLEEKGPSGSGSWVRLEVKDQGVGTASPRRGTG